MKIAIIQFINSNKKQNRSDFKNAQIQIPISQMGSITGNRTKEIILQTQIYIFFFIYCIFVWRYVKMVEATKNIHKYKSLQYCVVFIFNYTQFIFYFNNNIEFMRQYKLNIWVYQFYMIKYILQKYVNPNDHAPEDQQKLKANTEDHVTNYSMTALKNLKQTQDNIDALKRRLSVLSIKDKKNQKKLQQNLKKLEFHSKVQESIARDKTKKQKYQQKVKRQLQETKQKIQEFKKDHTDNLQSAKSSLFENKKRDYEKIKKQSDQMEKSLEKRKIQQITSKANQRKAICQMQKLQKEHIVEYFLRKKSSFRDSSVRQGSRYDSRRSQRQKLLQELSARESQLIQRQSASRAALDESAKRMPKISIAKSMHRQRSTSDYSQLMPPIGRNQQYIFS